MVLWNGNFEAEATWHRKTQEAFEEINLPSSKDYASDFYEIDWVLLARCAVYLLLDMPTESASLLNAIGFTWDKDGFANFASWYLAIKAAFPEMPDEATDIWNRLAIFLSSSPGTINEAEVNEWIPSASELAKANSGIVQIYMEFDLTGFGARAFLKLGRDDEACELARLAIAPEQDTKKKTTLILCHSVLGQVAAKRGQMDDADTHFSRALEEAKLSRLPLLEVVAARDWKKYALDPASRDCSAADAAIDEACAKMKKTRDQLSPVLG